MLEKSKWSIWLDENSDFMFGPNQISEEFKVIEQFDTFEEARQAWIFYRHFLKKIF